MSKVVKRLLEPKEKGYTWKHLFKDVAVYRESPIPQHYLEKLAAALKEWARSNPEAISVYEFTTEYDIPYRTYNYWCNKYEILRDADDIARALIGIKTRRNALTRTWDPHSSFRLLHCYDPDARQDFENKQAHELAMKTPPAPEVNKELYELYAYKDAQGEIQLVDKDGTITKAKCLANGVPTPLVPGPTSEEDSSR